MPIYSSSEQTYEALLGATGEMAAEQGFANLSTRAIAKRAGVNVSSLHYHFGGKDKLFEAVVRRIVESLDKPALDEILAGLEAELDSPNGQALAVRGLVREHIRSMFLSGKPSWYCKVLYQVMQYENPLFDMIYAEYVEKENVTLFTFFRNIRHELTLDDLLSIRSIILSQLLFHVDYKLPILKMLGASEYDEAYLKRLEDLLTTQLQHFLGLPEDK